MWEKIKLYLYTASGLYTFLFILIYLIAWVYNATKGSRFNLKELIELYGFVQTQILVKYGIDSSLNSEKGKPIEK